MSLGDVGLYVPARNAAKTLDACLDAIAALDPAPCEVLVVADPRSRDATVAVASARRGIRVIEQGRPGLPTARNEALRALSTPWVASVDADVVVEPDWLGALAAARSRFPEAVGIAGRTEERVAGLGDLWRALMHPHHWGAHPVDGPFMIVSEALLRRDPVLAIGGYRESLERYGDDSRLSRDLRDAGHRLAYVPDALGLHVRHDDVLGALDLRWDYARPRMEPWLGDLAGLAGKTAKNLEYGRAAVARGRLAGVPELAAAGAFLPLHHALLDLRALLTARRLPAEVAGGAIADLGRALCGQAGSIAGVEPVLAALRARLGAEGPPRPLAWPRWIAHREAIATALRAWLDEVAAVLEAAPGWAGPIAADRTAGWAARFGGPSPPGRSRSVSPWPTGDDLRPDPRASARIVEVDVSRIRPGAAVTILAAAPVETVVRGAGSLRHTSDPSSVGAAELLVIPAVEQWSAPRAVLARALPEVGAAILGHRAPERVDGREVLAAADLVEACAGAGLRIEAMQTFVAHTELDAARPPSGA